MREHLRPQYAKEFRCIGGACEDLCCRGWDVFIDKATYQKYQSVADLQPVPGQHFTVLSNSSDNLKYAKINFAPNCPFLSSDFWCTIHSRHGEDYLPPTCRNYPRNPQRIDGLMEQPLCLSCPEAARLVLLTPDLLKSNDGSPAGSRYQQFQRATTVNVGKNGEPEKFIWDLRGFTLLLMQDRSYPFWQRMFIFGMFCKRLGEMLAASQSALIPNLLKDYSGIIEQGRLRSAMEGIPVRLGPQLVAVLEVVHRHLELTDPNYRIHECLPDFMQGIHYKVGRPVGDSVPHYQDAYTRYYAPFMEKHPYILENYFVNHIFRTRFPFALNSGGEALDAKTQHLLMCLQYCIIKGLLIGMAGHYRESFGTEHIVKLIQSVAKVVEHSARFPEHVNRELATADGMALLLKN